MLRKYQAEAVDKMLWNMKMGGNGVIVLPTGSGKTHVISEFVRQIDKPVLILVLSKELLMQNHDKLSKVVPESEIGIYSASLNSKEVKRYTLATIQSACKHPEQFAHYDATIIDECHSVNPKKLQGMYNKFFKAIGKPAIIGLTATPYRQDIFYRKEGGWSGYGGSIYEKMNLEAVTTTKMINRYKERFWHRILYVMNTHELQEQGYLSNLEYTDLSVINSEDIPLNKSQSDFNLEAFEELISDDEKDICMKIIEISKNHKSLLVFCSSVDQAIHMSDIVKGSNVVYGDLGKKARDKAINSFRENGGVMFNVGILTTGFDYPELEAIALIRPTRSLNLYNQMLGRLTRIADYKDTGFVYDFSGTVKSLGKLESIKIIKTENKFPGGYPQWDVVSETKPDGYHYKQLYSYSIS